MINGTKFGLYDMNVYLVLQNLFLFRSNWLQFPKLSDKVILIVNEETSAKLPAAQHAFFDSIYRLPQFNYENLIKTIEQIKAVLPTSVNIKLVTHDETCMEMMAKLREYFNFIGEKPGDIERFINKASMKKSLAQTNIVLPKHCYFNREQYLSDPETYIKQLIGQLTFPLFVKPINSAASQYTAKLHNVQELRDWCLKHDKNYDYEIDEFINGKLYCCESIMYDNKILFSHVCLNAHPCFDFMSGKVNGTITLPQEDEIVQRIIMLNQQVLQAMQPVPNGLIHLEVFRRENDELVFLELACRPPGGMIIQSYAKRFGIDIEQIHFGLQMGIKNIFSLPQQSEPYSAWVWFPYKAGKVKRFLDVSLQSSHESFWKININDELPSSTSLIDYSGGILLWNANYETLLQDFNYLASFNQPPIDVYE
jgi:biotin carboxylase